MVGAAGSLVGIGERLPKGSMRKVLVFIFITVLELWRGGLGNGEVSVEERCWDLFCFI